jgi:hypothetical protein
MKSRRKLGSLKEIEPQPKLLVDPNREREREREREIICELGGQHQLLGG